MTAQDTKEELDATRRMLGAAQVRVKHYEQALQLIAGCSSEGYAKRIATEALSADTPVKEPRV